MVASSSRDKFATENDTSVPQLPLSPERDVDGDQTPNSSGSFAGAIRSSTNVFHS